MKLAIMQPYFIPYLGYFQLINAVDIFVIYDNIQYSKSGWIQRNRILVNGEPSYISLPLRSDSDYKDIVDRCLSDDFKKESGRLLRRIASAYHNAPYFNEIMPLVHECISFDEPNLFSFVRNSLLKVCNHLGISTPIITSSILPVSHDLKSQDRVIATCIAMKATDYFNPIGGVELYSAYSFSSSNIGLKFLKSRLPQYFQGCQSYVPALSIIDVMMFNPVCVIRTMLNEYDLLEPTLVGSSVG